MHVNCKRNNALISGLICAILLAVMFSSIFFIIKEADHDCTGADCPICNKIQACVQALETIGSAVGVKFAVAAALFCAVLILTAGKSIHIMPATPVSLKVKLTN